MHKHWRASRSIWNEFSSGSGRVRTLKSEIGILDPKSGGPLPRFRTQKARKYQYKVTRNSINFNPVHSVAHEHSDSSMSYFGTHTRVS